MSFTVEKDTEEEEDDEKDDKKDKNKSLRIEIKCKYNWIRTSEWKKNDE